jgi:hypothetical protein
MENIELQIKIFQLCIRKKRLSYTLNDFINQESLRGYNIHRILDSLKQMHMFFEVIESRNQGKNQGTIINISIKLRACKNYISGKLCNETECNMLHICESKLNKNYKLYCICLWNHSLETKHNKDLLKNSNILFTGYPIILDFYRVTFYYIVLRKKI